MKNIIVDIKIPKILNKLRIDKALSILMNKKYSRSYIKNCILKKLVTVNKKIITKSKKKVLYGDKITMNLLPNKEKFLLKPIPQNINLNIIYEDKDILIINKKNDIVVHPGISNEKNTILNAVIYHYPKNIKIPRAGIVHRLDKNTTGLMMIAKNIDSYFFLVNLLKNRKISREYRAIVYGKLQNNLGTINQPLKRNINKRMRMMVHQHGKQAITHYALVKKFNNYSYIKLKLETGRTHQIRVHMSYINHFIIGDQTYRKIIHSKNYTDQIFNKFNRQALHANKLKFIHPINKKYFCFKSSIPSDMQFLLNILKKSNV